MTSITQRLSRVQQHLKAPKEKNQNVSYKSRSAEQILEAAKEHLEEGEFIVCKDEIVFIGNRYYIKATAIFGFEKDYTEGVGYAREPEDALTANGKPMMSPAQITGSSSSYARKYSLQGLFALDDSKDDPDKNEVQQPKKLEPDAAFKNAKSFVNQLINDMKLSGSIEALEVLLNNEDAKIQRIKDNYPDLYEGIEHEENSIRDGGFDAKPKVKFASVKDALDGWEKMQTKLLTLETLPEVKEWILKITPYLDEMDRVLTADKYKNDKGQTPRQELEANIDFHSKTILAKQG